MQLELPLLTREARLGETWRLTGRGRELRVAAPARAAARASTTRTLAPSDPRAARRGVPHLRPHRHGELDRSPVRAVLPGPTAAATALGDETLLGAERGEVAQSRVGRDRDSPPLPPSPPSGPPLGTYFSRRKLSARRRPVQPHVDVRPVVEHRSPPPPAPETQLVLGVSRGHADEALLAAAAELDDALAQREDRVVAAEACARTRTKPRAALAHDDHPGLDDLAGEDLDAEPLATASRARSSRSRDLSCVPSLLLAPSRRVRTRAPRSRPCGCRAPARARAPQSSPPRPMLPPHP